MCRGDKNHLILDFGCGEGDWLKENGGPNVIGIDINPNYLKKAKLKAKEGTVFILCDGCHLPFKDKSFRMVHVNYTLHHMNDYESVIDEIDRVLDGFFEMKEAIDNDFLFRKARRVASSPHRATKKTVWHEGGRRNQYRELSIRSFFTSSELERKIRKKFVITRIELGGYTPLWFPFAYSRFSLPTQFLKKIWGRIEMTYGVFLKKLGIDKTFATWIAITGHNKIHSGIMGREKGNHKFQHEL